MIKWRDVLKALVCCGTVLFVVLGIIWAIETQWKIEALQEDIEKLRSAQRPLVQLEGKYLNVFTSEREVIIETAESKEVDRSR